MSQEQATAIKNQTKITKHFSLGWNGETLTTDKGGQLWKISTCKRSGGKITSRATKCQKAESSNGVQMTQFSMQDMSNSKTLISTTGRATEKTIKEQHYKAIAVFDEQDESKPGEQAKKKKACPIKRGLEFFMWGYQRENQVLVVTGMDDRGVNYVNTETKAKGFTDRLRPWSEKFGIGYYYRDNDIKYHDESNLVNLEIDAAQKIKAADEAREQEKRERQAKIDAYIDKVVIPDNAVGLITGEFKEDRSDSQSDYFHHTSINTIYLAWTFKKRDDFREMRKAALNADDTKELHDCSKDWEHREKYTGGNGYYLGESKYSGWNIEKHPWYNNPDLKSIKEKLAIAMAEGRYFIPSDDKPKEQEAKANVEPVQAEGIEILDYSERSFAIFGNTKPYASILGRKGLKLKFNKWLTHPETNETCVGWIFPKTREDEVRKALGLA